MFCELVYDIKQLKIRFCFWMMMLMTEIYIKIRGIQQKILGPSFDLYTIPPWFSIKIKHPSLC